MSNNDHTDNTKDKIMKTKDECQGNNVIKIEKMDMIVETKNEQKIYEQKR